MITLDSGEVIKKVIRGGGVLLFVEFIFIAVVAILPIVLYKWNALDNLLSVDPTKINYLLLFFYGMWLLVCWIFLFSAWMEYYLGAWIITDARVLSARPIGFLKRESIGVRFDRIKEVDLGLKGSVKIVLIHDGGTILIPKVRHPEAVKELIMYEQKKAFERLKVALTIDEVEMGMV